MRISTFFDKLLFKTIDVQTDKIQNADMIDRLNRQLGIDVRIERDVSYSDIGENCVCDLYSYPLLSGLTRYPVMVYIHGGGFVAGDKKYRRSLATWYASMGMFVVNINYSLSAEYQFPQAVKECTEAINFVFSNAEKYNLDKSKVFVGGDSSGAYLASMTACMSYRSDLQLGLKVKPIGKLAGVILNCGLYDLETAMSNKTPFDLCGSICYDYTGVKVSDIKNYEYYHYLSPINFVSEGHPESLVIYAKQDIFCKGQSEAYIGRLKEHSVPVVDFYSDSMMENHCFCLNWSSKKGAEANKLIADFINERIFS